MKMFLLYGTTEGQTRKIAEFITEKFRSQGDDVALHDATALRTTPDLAAYDAAILAASIHAHQYQSSIIDFAREHYARLNEMPSLFISVSLSAAGTDPEDRASIEDCAERFHNATRWTKAEVVHVAGAFRFTKYDFFKGWIMRMIARQKKVKVKPGEDLELTDWEALAKHIADFRARLVAAPARPLRKAG